MDTKWFLNTMREVGLKAVVIDENTDWSNPLKDLQGREYAKLSALQDGSFVQVDYGFDCMPGNSIHKVRHSDDGLYIQCKDGRHYLYGQADNGEDLVGVYHWAPPYPFCRHPEKCIHGRCEAEIVCND